MPRNNTIAKNTLFLTAQTIFVLLVSLYTARVILKVLGVEDFGIYNVVGGFVSLFAFLNTSMINGIQRFYNYEYGKNGEKGLTKVYNTALTIQVVLAIIVFLLTESFGLWYINDVMVIPSERLTAAKYIFHFAVLSLLFVIMQIPYSSAIIAHEHMGYFATINVIDTALKLAIAMAIPIFPMDKLIIYGFLILLISVIDWLLYYSYAKIKFPEIKYQFQFDKSLFLEMVSFSGWNMFGSFSGVMREQGINMILNLFFGPVINAARGIAYQINSALMGFVANINTASRPQLTQSYASGDLGRSINIMYSMSRFGLITLAVFAVPVIYEIDYILKIWLDTDIPPHTNTFAQLVIVNSIFLCLNPPVSFMVHATGKMKKYQVITTLFSLLVLPVSYCILIIGAAPEFVFALLLFFTIIGQAICVYILSNLIPFSIRDYLKRVIFPLLLFLIFIPFPPLIPRCLMEQSFLRLLIVSFVSFGTTCITAFFVVLDSSERVRILSLIKK